MKKLSAFTPLESRKILTAFTLIEMLVVIAIIALLMAILIPSLRKAQIQVRTVVCQNNLKQWGTTLALYVENNNGRLPPDRMRGLWLLRGPQLNEGDPNVPLIYHNLTTKGISLCPMASEIGKHNATHIQKLGDYKIICTYGSKLTAWEIIYPEPNFPGSYGWNQWVFNGFREVSRLKHIGSQSLLDRKLGINIFTMKNIASFPVLLDCGLPLGGLSNPPVSENVYGTTFCIDRHDGFINSLFLDWSVRKVGLKELWKLKWHENFNTANCWTIAGGVQPEDWPEWMRGFKDY